MKHSKARNCIVRCFGNLKATWAVLRDKSFYSIKTHYRIISTCCILHNFIISKMAINPIESEVGFFELNAMENYDDGDLIKHCETNLVWTEWRDKLAHEMFISW